jgi:hypothetical protein
MKTFHEWVEENHPGTIEEGFFKNLALGAMLGAGAMGVGGKMLPKMPNPLRGHASAAADIDDEGRGIEAKEKKLQSAARRVGIPRSQWGNLRGHMTGGVVTIVNGKKVPLTPEEAETVRWARDLSRRMGN